MHSVQKLYFQRQAQSTREFKARGAKINRCSLCQISKQHCICHLRQSQKSHLAFCLFMYDSEVLKPSNTGRLIADCFEDTHAFLWSRTEIDPKIIELLNSDKYQPFIVFPKDYASEDQIYFEEKPDADQCRHSEINLDKTPLLILLDGTWREASKIFRKSPYLKRLPILSIPSKSLEKDNHSTYSLRNSDKLGYLGTAEVAAKIVEMFGEKKNAKHLQLWFDVFCYRYQLVKKSISLHQDLPVKLLNRYRKGQL